MNFEEVEEVFSQAFSYITRPYLKIVVASYVANYLERPPFWLLVKGPPGIGKTELLRIFELMDDAVFVSVLTEKALASRFRDKSGKDYSLISQLHKKVLIILDFSTILELWPVVRNYVFAQFRSAYDGKFLVASGTGSQEYPVKFGFLGATTPRIDKASSLNVQLGERFLIMEMEPASREVQEKILEEASRNLLKLEGLKKSIYKKVKQYIEGLYIDRAMEVPESLLPKLRKLASTLGVLRSHIERHPVTTQVEFEPFSESSSRVFKQLLVFVKALLIMEEEDPLEYARRLVKDSITTLRRKILIKALRTGLFIPKEFDSIVSRQVVLRNCLDLAGLGVFSFEKKRKGEMVFYITEEWKEPLGDLFQLQAGKRQAEVIYPWEEL